MTTLLQTEVRKNFLQILARVQKGEEIIIHNEKDGKNVAVLVAYEKYQHKDGKPKERKLGILEGKATYKIHEDFKITEEEMLSL